MRGRPLEDAGRFERVSSVALGELQSLRAGQAAALSPIAHVAAVLRELRAGL